MNPLLYHLSYAAFAENPASGPIEIGQDHPLGGNE
jgi:hypothetical protein